MTRWLQLLLLFVTAPALASLPHAVKTVGSIRSYGYDANGNMISVLRQHEASARSDAGFAA